MAKQIQAVYEQGLIRPLQPLDLPEGSQVDVIIITHEQPQTTSKAVEMIADIAALAVEGPKDAFSGRKHDLILYSKINSEQI